MAFFRGGICEDCWSALAPPPAGCPVCADPLPGPTEEPCGRCQLDPPAYSCVRAAAAYRGVARRALIAFKFEGADYLGRHLAETMVQRIPSRMRFDEVVAVPATRLARLRSDHGAEMLAAEVAARLGVPFAARRLRKIRRTQRQSALPVSRRASNVRGVFRARPGAPERVLLVDDVATSGSTAREAAVALRSGGAGEVEVWCFARASRDAWLLDETVDRETKESKA